MKAHTWFRGRSTTSKPSAVQMLKSTSERSSGTDNESRAYIVCLHQKTECLVECPVLIHFCISRGALAILAFNPSCFGSVICILPYPQDSNIVTCVRLLLLPSTSKLVFLLLSSSVSRFPAATLPSSLKQSFSNFQYSAPGSYRS